jgi:hypothetical protein
MDRLSAENKEKDSGKPKKKVKDLAALKQQNIARVMRNPEYERMADSKRRRQGWSERFFSLFSSGVAGHDAGSRFTR